MKIQLPAQLTALEDAAIAAEGSLEMRCQVAMANIYKVAGLLPPDVEIPDGPRDWARAQGRSLILDWLQSHPEHFSPAPAPGAPGDLIVFQLGHTPHHVAILLCGGRLVHVFGAHGVRIAPCIPTPWAKRIDSYWRLA